MDAKIKYVLANTKDPEERLEDACLWKAMHDVYGESIELAEYEDLEDRDVWFGRTKTGKQKGILPVPDHIEYWTDPAFLSNCGREFYVCDFESAQVFFNEIKASGNEVFLKSTRSKHWIGQSESGQSFSDVMGAMALSFMDTNVVQLMVQQKIDMSFEKRFVVVNRRIVTSSPIAWHLSPLNHDCRNLNYETPADKSPSYFVSCDEEQTELAQLVAKQMKSPHAIIDIAMSGEKPVVVEFNPCVIGCFGLYACDPYAIAKASTKLLQEVK